MLRSFIMVFAVTVLAAFGAVSVASADEVGSDGIVVTEVTLTQLEANLAAAEAEVASLTGQIELKSQEVADAAAALLTATENEAAAQKAYDDADAALTKAKQDLADAQLALTAAQLTLAGVNCKGLNNNTTPTMNQCTRTREDAKEDRDAKQATVDQEIIDEGAAQTAFNEAKDVLTAAAAVTNLAESTHTDLTKELGGLQAALVLAEAEVVSAKAAVEAFVVPVVDKPSACKGLTNAQSKVDAKSKGKAPAIIGNLVANLGC